MCEAHVKPKDISRINVMMDPTGLWPELYHPRAKSLTKDLQHLARYLTRTARPVKYYLIDFGISVQFDPDDKHPAAIPILGGDKTVPEYQDRDRRREAHNPFPADVYYLGNLIRTWFLRVRGRSYEKWHLLDN